MARRATAGTLNVTVNDVVPTVALTGAATTTEGSSYSLTVGAVTDPGQDTVTQYIIHWGDGQDEIILAANLPAGGVVPHVYADGPASRTITVDLVNDDGTHLTAGTLAVTVNDVAPTVALTGATTTNEGSSYSLTIGAVTDPGQDTVAQYILHWGDGQDEIILAANLSAGGVVPHVYADGPASRTITVDLVNEDGTHLTAGTLAVTVNDIAPTVALTGDDDERRFELFADHRSCNRSGASTVAQYLINWGDGQDETIPAADLPAGGIVPHVYADGPASRTITVDLVNDDGTHLAAGMLAVTVNDVAPTITLTGAATTDEGSSYSLTIGAVTDPGQDTVQYVIHWGDGQDETIPLANLPAGGVVPHLFADGPASRTITVDLVNEDGTHLAAGTLVVTVADVAPTVTLIGEATVDEGDSYSLTIGS